ncbi:hypothetical protein BLL42_05095 [Pseudomonas frederiksbergensis]|uniref:Nucleotide modification associated domain-containing protein n=1 Tax=Pseudomonas frederiksbergensis TaxID=104087 RepID=A0A1J0EH33_9PSED|nr:Nmad5 family putative nucleotide modification protein [Pseudomonas frederiksbergensis]APC15124.1 hypothetical protein BLL42_05095 [Pseudomonas frederiksbergensis]
MSKPFSITNAMRNTIADQLTVQAVAQSGPAISQKLQAANNIFWSEHASRVSALPGLDREHWAELIQVGSVTAVSTCVPTTPVQEGQNFYSREFLKFYFSDREAQAKALFVAVMTSPAFAGVADLVKQSERYSNTFSLRFKSLSGSVPRTHSMSDIPGEHPIVTTCRQIQVEMNELLQAAATFRGQVIDVLITCRSSRQVEELFPEAAQLLPKPIKNEQQLAPVELIASVRATLSKGVAAYGQN